MNRPDPVARPPQQCRGIRTAEGCPERIHFQGHTRLKRIAEGLDPGIADLSNSGERALQVGGEGVADGVELDAGS